MNQKAQIIFFPMPMSGGPISPKEWIIALCIVAPFLLFIASSMATLMLFDYDTYKQMLPAKMMDFATDYMMGNDFNEPMIYPILRFLSLMMLATVPFGLIGWGIAEILERKGVI